MQLNTNVTVDLLKTFNDLADSMLSTANQAYHNDGQLNGVMAYPVLISIESKLKVMKILLQACKEVKL